MGYGLLSHLTEQVTPHPLQGMAAVVYVIPCKDCMWERPGGVSKKAHIDIKKDVKELSGPKYTRVQKKISMPELHQSTSTDLMAQVNNVIDWESVKVSPKDPASRCLPWPDFCCAS